MHNWGSFQKLCAVPLTELRSYHHHVNLDSPLDYPCQVCQRIDNADQMLLCDNCNGGYQLFCLKPELTQVLAGIWY
jgi:hypothetical protein